MAPAELRFLGSLLLFGGFFATSTGKPLPTVSPTRVYVPLGDGAILPCRVSTPVDITVDDTVAVEWSRTDRTSVLHAVRQGEELEKEQHAEYSRRTAMMRDGSLELRNVTLQDYGNLKCVVVRNPVKEMAYVSLIQAKVSEILFTVKRTPSNQLTVHCVSSGWSPEPLISLNTTGNAAPARKETPVEEGGLFTVGVHQEFSAFKGNVALTCRVEIPGSRILKEQTIIIIDEFDSLAVCFCNSCIFLWLVFLVIGVVLVVFWGWQHLRHRSPEDEAPDEAEELNADIRKAEAEAEGEGEAEAEAQGAPLSSETEELASPDRRKCTEYGDILKVTTRGASKYTVRKGLLFDRKFGRGFLRPEIFKEPPDVTKYKRFVSPDTEATTLHSKTGSSVRHKWGYDEDVYGRGFLRPEIFKEPSDVTKYKLSVSPDTEATTLHSKTGSSVRHKWEYDEDEDLLTLSTREYPESLLRYEQKYMGIQEYEEVSGELPSGVIGSYILAKSDWRRMRKYEDMIKSVGLELGIHPALIAAIISRQSRGGVYLKLSGFGRGDPECYGIMQINRAYHAVKGNPYSREHVDQGVTFLIQLVKTMWRTKTNWTREQQLKGALACYIAGENKVIPVEDPEDVDKVTPYQDFANDVVARAHWFSRHGYEV